MAHPTEAPSREAHAKQESRGDDGLHQKPLEMREDVEELGAHVRDVASKYYQQGREKAQLWEHNLEDKIREKPLQSLCIAGGIGLLLGFLLKRK